MERAGGYGQSSTPDGISEKYRLTKANVSSLISRPFGEARQRYGSKSPSIIRIIVRDLERVLS
ncbi:MAG: hypothetical protein QM296_11970, partial [Bacillota bacterium]|nr:hypothetical protein [Bacillota bacterium]